MWVGLMAVHSVVAKAENLVDLMAVHSVVAKAENLAERSVVQLAEVDILARCICIICSPKTAINHI
jgi:hypothetical protein